MQKCFVLDTNVLLHNPESLEGFSDNVVVIPLTVIEELDHFKRAQNKTGVHARQVLRKIGPLVEKGLIKKGIPFNSGGLLRVVIGNHHKKRALDNAINDNKIIGTATELKREYPSVIFVSKDTNARIKAAALGLRVMDFEKQKVNYDVLYKGWKREILTSKKFDSFCKDRSMAVNGDYFPNQHILIQKGESKKSTIMAWYNDKKKAIHQITNERKAMGVKPLNIEQRFVFNILLNPDIKFVTIVGKAGTGKTLLALACGLEQVIEQDSIYDKLLVARPVIPMGKDIGYLPGTKDEKLANWMQPIFDNLAFIFNDNKRTQRSNRSSDSVSYLLDTKQLEIEALTYIRGRSIPKQYIIIDEAQNLTPHEVKTIVSRAGKGTKIVLTGDPAQIDNPYLDENSNGLSYAAERLKSHAISGHILLSKSERSDLAAVASDLL